MIKDFEKAGLFGLGQPNETFAQYFIGKSYLNPICMESIGILNVTFEPKCRNNWHIHRATKGGGQVLLCTCGEGWYQEWGKEPRKLTVGDSVIIPPEVKHWHGASKDSWFAHVAIEVPGENATNEWCEAVTDEEYDKL